MAEINNPHDKFFKETFSHLEITQDFLRHYLPSAISRLLNLDTLALMKDSYIDHALQEQFSDLLFSVETASGQEIRVYILFEHKSYPERMIAFHLLRYMVRIWENDIKNGCEYLTPIFPLVVYHGETEWRISERFSDLLPRVEELRPYWPDFQYFLFDLSRYADQDLVGKSEMQSVLRLLKHIFNPRLEDRLEEIFAPVVVEKDRIAIRDFLETMVLYLINGTDRLGKEKVIKELNETLRKGGFDLMPTIAEQLREEGELRGIAKGREEGREEGREDGFRESIYNILSIRFDHVPMEIINSIQDVSRAEILKEIQKLAVTVSSLEDFIHRLTEYKMQK